MRLQFKQMYSLAMIILPISSFFIVKHFISRFIEGDPNVYAAVTAVFLVHCVLVGFVIKAYKEDKMLSEGKKITDKID